MEDITGGKGEGIGSGSSKGWKSKGGVDKRQ